ncbi:MAG TPA: sensor histidine kinase, partial [Paludibacter sp.]
AVKIDMGMLKLNVLKDIDKKRSEELHIKFDNLSVLIDNTIKTARKIMTDLRPEVLDMIGFVETVRQHLNSFKERHKVSCNLVTSDSHLELSTQQSVALFRIIQEALNNIAKHAKATEVNVIVNKRDKKLILEIEDNGVGFEQNQKKNHDSYGLIGMKERVFLLDGELSIKSKVGKGTTVQVIVPFDGK